MKTPTKTPLIVGNWKMHKTGAEAAHFFATLPKEVTAAPMRICIAAPFTAISAAVFVAQALNISIGGQNMHDQEEGAFTGEISCAMLKAAGAEFVLLGHSERRHLFGETNAWIHRKVKRALAGEITPILCIGETLEERESGGHERVLAQQLEECLFGLTQEEMLRIAIAYEPVWAIGTGKTATPEIAQETHQFIREWLAKQYGEPLSSEIYLLYGGSVKPDNTAVLMQQKDIDGVLVGGASLDPKNFAQIINYSRVSL